MLALTKASQSTEYYHDWQVIGSSSGAAGSSGGAWADATDAATDAAEDQEDESTKVEIEVEVREDEDPANYDYPPMDSATEAAWSSVYPEDKARSVPVVALNLFFIPSSFCLSSLQVELIETLGKISPALKMAAIDLRLDRRCLCATCLKFQR